MGSGRGFATPVIALVLASVVALACATASPVMALMEGDHCSGPACAVMTGCGPALAPQIASAPLQPVAVVPTGPQEPTLERAEPRGNDPPFHAAVRRLVASLGSRSPPTA